MPSAVLLGAGAWFMLPPLLHAPHAGNVGAKERFEYTVIGEPVNEAARLAELARSEPSRALASAETVAAASEREQRFWRIGRPVRLRGYPERVRIASLVGGT